DSVNFHEIIGDQDGIPESGETIQPIFSLCNYGESAINLTIQFSLNHPDVTVTSSLVSVGNLDCQECRTIDGPVFDVSGSSGWGIPVVLSGDWAAGSSSGQIEIPFSLHGIEFHVDPVIGDDMTGDGQPDTPVKTIGKARDISRGSRFHPITLRLTSGTYSESANGESWPLYLDEYEDLRGEGESTLFLNETYTHSIIRPSRTSNLFNFNLRTSIDNHGWGIRATCTENVLYSGLFSTPYDENGCGIGLIGRSILTLENCVLPGIGSQDYEPGDSLLINNSHIENVLCTGSATLTNNIIGPDNFDIYQWEDFPGNIVIQNSLLGTTELNNYNIFEDNICEILQITTNADISIVNTVYVDGGSLVLDSGGVVTFTNNMGIKTSSYALTYNVVTSNSPNYQNCISLPLICDTENKNCFSAWMSSFNLNGCIALFSDTGIDHDLCLQTRNSAIYYNRYDNSDCWNTQYSDLVNCPDPTNIDQDPGFIGISWISDIGSDYFTDDTAAWEPDRYAGYYVNPNILDNDNLFYCTGNSEDTIFVMGDPRGSAQIGDLFVIPDLRLRKISNGFAFDSPLIDAGDPTIYDPDGTRRDIGPYGGPYALTPMPIIPTFPPPESTPTPPIATVTPYPTITPSPTVTPTQTITPTETNTPTITPTSTPRSTGVRILMPSHLYYPDDICWCSVSIYINAPEPLFHHPLFVLLDVYGEIFFAPSFSQEIDAWPGPWNSGETVIEILAHFSWPETGTSVNNVYWYAAITDPDVTQIFGECDMFEFGWE
ncbi:hypothetical protein K8T06_11035, partial [bacterium]|nr:hypothetical protein [bacterium]